MQKRCYCKRVAQEQIHLDGVQPATVSNKRFQQHDVWQVIVYKHHVIWPNQTDVKSLQCSNWKGRPCRQLVHAGQHLALILQHHPETIFPVLFSMEHVERRDDRYEWWNPRLQPISRHDFGLGGAGGWFPRHGWTCPRFFVLFCCTDAPTWDLSHLQTVQIAQWKHRRQQRATEYWLNQRVASDFRSTDRSQDPYSFPWPFLFPWSFQT